MNQTLTKASEASIASKARRRQLGERVASGKLPMGIVVMRPCEVAEKLTVQQLLRFKPRMGRSYVNRICRAAGVLPTEQLRELTVEERRRLVQSLPASVVRMGWGE